VNEDPTPAGVGRNYWAVVDGTGGYTSGLLMVFKPVQWQRGYNYGLIDNFYNSNLGVCMVPILYNFTAGNAPLKIGSLWTDLRSCVNGSSGTYGKTPVYPNGPNASIYGIGKANGGLDPYTLWDDLDSSGSSI
jgi:hypothetical protein